MAGRLGVALLDALVAEQVLVVCDRPDAGPDPILDPGRAQRHELTEQGRRRLAALGLLVDAAGRRPLVRYCLDWSEQRPHLGGVLGAAFLQHFVEFGWVVRGERRVVRVTDAGRAGMTNQLGVSLDDLG